VTIREPSEYAGKTVKIRDDVAQFGGREYRVEDWWVNVYGGSWKYADGNPAAMQYGLRAGLALLPADDEVLYGKVDGLGALVHISEIEVPAVTAPAKPNAELAWRTYDAINANPAHFDMDNWVQARSVATIDLEQLTGPGCGTTACFAGWALALSGYQLTPNREVILANRMIPKSIPELAADLLRIGEYEAGDLFYVDNEEFNAELIEQVFGPRPGGAS
jgi:hypothetical protein